MFHTRMATYKNVNTFAGVPMFLICVLETFKYFLMFLICVLETFKYFYKLPLSFLFHTRTATYRNMSPLAGVPMFLIWVLETFNCFYKQPFSFLFWLCLPDFCMFDTCLWPLIRNIIYVHKSLFNICYLFTYCKVVITIYMDMNTSTHVQMFLIFISNISLSL